MVSRIVAVFQVEQACHHPSQFPTVGKNDRKVIQTGDVMIFFQTRLLDQLKQICTTSPQSSLAAFPPVQDKSQDTLVESDLVIQVGYF